MMHQLTLASGFFLAAWMLVFPKNVTAWDIEVGTNSNIDEVLYVDSATGSFTWTTIAEGVFAGSGVGSIPSTLTLQPWDTGTMTWPMGSIDQEVNSVGVSAFATMEHYGGMLPDSTDDEFADFASASVFGDIPSGEAYGAGWAYDFELTLEVGTEVTLFLDPANSYVYMETAAGDDGFAFANLELFSTDVGLNDPGGANNPYASAPYFLSSASIGDVIDENPTFVHTFSNVAGASPLTYQLRLAGSSLVFENVSAIPEPSSLLPLCVAAMTLVNRRRRLS